MRFTLIARTFAPVTRRHRFKKHDAYYLAIVKPAATKIWMRFYESVILV